MVFVVYYAIERIAPLGGGHFPPSPIFCGKSESDAQKLVKYFSQLDKSDLFFYKEETDPVTTLEKWQQSCESALSYLDTDT